RSCRRGRRPGPVPAARAGRAGRGTRRRPSGTSRAGPHPATSPRRCPYRVSTGVALKSSPDERIPPASAYARPVNASPWWHGMTVYHVYPRSFADGNGDGIGDLRGLIDRLDYIVDLGVDTVWLSPFFTSPQHDYGYDVSDYRDVAPEYGT